MLVGTDEADLRVGREQTEGNVEKLVVVQVRVEASIEGDHGKVCGGIGWCVKEANRA